MRLSLVQEISEFIREHSGKMKVSELAFAFCQNREGLDSGDVHDTIVVMIDAGNLDLLKGFKVVYIKPPSKDIRYINKGRRKSKKLATS